MLDKMKRKSMGLEVFNVRAETEEELGLSVRALDTSRNSSRYYSSVVKKYKCYHLKAHLETISALLPFNGLGCFMTVSHDGYKRVWNCEGDCLGQMPLPNLSDAMKNPPEPVVVNPEWTFSLDKFIVTEAHHKFAGQLIHMVQEENKMKESEFNKALMTPRHNSPRNDANANHILLPRSKKGARRRENLSLAPSAASASQSAVTTARSEKEQVVGGEGRVTGGSRPSTQRSALSPMTSPQPHSRAGTAATTSSQATARQGSPSAGERVPSLQCVDENAPHLHRLDGASVASLDSFASTLTTHFTHSTPSDSKAALRQTVLEDLESGPMTEQLEKLPSYNEVLDLMKSDKVVNLPVQTTRSVTTATTAASRQKRLSSPTSCGRSRCGSSEPMSPNPNYNHNPNPNPSIDGLSNYPPSIPASRASSKATASRSKASTRSSTAPHRSRPGALPSLASFKSAGSAPSAAGVKRVSTAAKSTRRLLPAEHGSENNTQEAIEALTSTNGECECMLVCMNVKFPTLT